MHSANQILFINMFNDVRKVGQSRQLFFANMRKVPKFRFLKENIFEDERHKAVKLNLALENPVKDTVRINRSVSGQVSRVRRIMLKEICLNVPRPCFAVSQTPVIDLIFQILFMDFRLGRGDEITEP